MVFSIVEQFELKASQLTEMFSGVLETLEVLKGMNLKLALCTISGKKAVDYILDRFNLGHFFDAVTPREKVSAVKPDSVHLETSLNALKIKFQEAMLVGDSEKDMFCASSLNVLSVGVTTGLASKEDLVNSRAHYIVSSITDIPNLVRKLNKQMLQNSTKLNKT
jgi:phosphoglycolate phosphatase-like HAD superfamily hydrolase